MAIQLNLVQGIDTYPEAYAKITSQQSDNAGDKTNVTYHVSIWKSLAHKEAGEAPIDQDRYEVGFVTLASADFTGLYTDLLTKERYVGGVEV